MNKKTTIIIGVSLLVLLIAFVYVAYLIDARRISISADVESTASAQQLQELPSPDQSILSKIFSAITKPFTK